PPPCLATRRPLVLLPRPAAGIEQGRPQRKDRAPTARPPWRDLPQNAGARKNPHHLVGPLAHLPPPRTPRRPPRRPLRRRLLRRTIRQTRCDRIAPQAA